MRGPLIDESVYSVASSLFVDRMATLGDDECWPWTGTKNKLGYGTMKYKGVTLYAHRLSYFVFNGRLPSGEIDHKCRNPWCVNPGHIEDVTHKVNIDRSPHRHKDFCIRGHAMTGSNLYIKWERRPDGGTTEKHICKACRRERMRARGGWRR